LDEGHLDYVGLPVAVYFSTKKRKANKVYYVFIFVFSIGLASYDERNR
jgi:hypothetical protein